MRKHSIGSRLLSLLLALAMILPMLPALELGVLAAFEGADSDIDTAKFVLASEDGITMLDNGNNISMSIKVNNFVLDGMLFDYLSSTRSANDADDYKWEYCTDESSLAFVQLYPYKLRNQDLGQGAGSSGHGLADADGYVGVQADGTLDSKIEYSYGTNKYDDEGKRSDGKIAVRTVIPNTYTEYGKYLYASQTDATAFLRLVPTADRDTYGNNPDGSGKGRAWTKLTTFNSTQTVDNIRYVVLVYRLTQGAGYFNSSTGEKYDNMGLTVNCFDEANGHCSKYAAVQTSANSNWTYAIIDLMGLPSSNSKAIKTGTQVTEVYWQLPLNYKDTGLSIDLAAVGYFPYYGDAEQFAYYGLTLGCKQKYFNANNAGFSLRNNTNTHNFNGDTLTKVLVRSMPTFWQVDNEYPGARPTAISYLPTNEGYYDLTDTSLVKILEETGTNLYGSLSGEATFGLVEAQLGEDGRPVYKESVVHYLAAYLRHQLLTLPEYPYDNNGWRNYSFITGVSTSGATDEALFGKDELGRSMDFATALCKQLGVKKGGAITNYAGSFGVQGYYEYDSVSSDGAHYGSYAKTLAHKDELIGSWSECKDNIHTWFDAAYFMLQNLFVSETEVANSKTKDAYGDYEDDYREIILPQISHKGSNAYFFDSGYAYYTKKDDYTTYSTALVYDKTNHTITLSGDAQGAALFANKDLQDHNASAWFPFLITSGNGTQAGESNSSYYLHDGVLSRYTAGTTYRDRDFHYSLAGSGYFAYEKDLYFDFSGDDDVYVFINGQLVVDLGGTHGATYCSMHLDDYVDWAWSVKSGGAKYKGKVYGALSAADKARVDALCLEEGRSYSFDFFYMERHGVGSNLRIMTNMIIVSGGLDVDKSAYQGEEIEDNGIVNVNEKIEYSFSITNNSNGKLYDLKFVDDIIGVSLDKTNGLKIATNSTACDANGGSLDVSDLIITVDGVDSSGNKLDTVTVSFSSQAALKQFLTDLSSSGTSSGSSATDYHKLYEGSGLWKDATVTIRGIYYKMTDAQKAVAMFTNSVECSGLAMVASDEGVKNVQMRGVAKHTVFQPGSGYYQWVGNAIVIESEKIAQNLIADNVVGSVNDLPAVQDMILIPSDSSGTAIDNQYVSNTPGGDVYIKVNYTTAGSHMAYITIRDQSNPSYALTVPLTIHAVDGKDSLVVLDYGLSAYLTENDDILKSEIGSVGSTLEGVVLGIAADTITPSYQNYDENSIISAIGQVENKLELVAGKNELNDKYGEFAVDHTGAIYEFETPIFLDHNKPWVIEWRARHWGNSLMLSTMKTSSAGNQYVYLSTGVGRLFMGQHGAEGSSLGTGNTGYNNYGVTSDLIKAANGASGTMTDFKLVNVPDGAGGNMVYCYVNGTKVGALTQYHPSGSDNYKGESTWISGKDFTFNYMGTTAHDVDDVYAYFRVYEDGYQLTHSKWNGTSLTPTTTNEAGFVENTLTKKTNTASETYWTMNQPMTLAHDDNWRISFTAKAVNGTMILASSDSSLAYANHIYAATNATLGEMILLGYKNPASEGGGHINYGINIQSAISGFSLADEHTYVLENRVSPAGGNMVHLYVDGTYIGAMDTKYKGGSQLLATNDNGLSGMDFTFYNIGDNTSYGFASGSTISALEIRSKTTLHNAYEWIPGGDGLTATAAVDNAGNQINFTKDSDGIVTVNNGTFTLDSKGLKFEANGFMNSGYSVYVAVGLYEKGYAPSALEADAIDIHHEAQLYKKITVLPANVVYYEDDNTSIHYVGTKVNSFKELTENLASGYDDYSDTRYLATGSSAGLIQDSDQDTPYGSDPIYSGNTSNISGGSLHTIAINNDGPLAWFEFSGTGFQIVARTNATTSGTIFVEVYNKSDVTFSGDELGSYDITKAIKVIPVVSDFDQGNLIGDSFQTNNGGSEAIYQVPLIQYSQEEVSDLVVIISGVENVIYSDNERHVDTYLYLDGIRLYNSYGKNPTIQDGEEIIDPYGNQSNVVFEEVRDYLINGDMIVLDYSDHNFSASTGTMTWVEKYTNQTVNRKEYIGNAVTSVDEYLMKGPNNEVYLDGTFTTGAVAFYVLQTSTVNQGVQGVLQVGVRALDMGLYYGAGSTGRRANLALGVKSGDSVGWLYMGNISSSSEQYINVDYTMCPTVDIDGLTYYQVVIKVDSFSESIPAMVSLTNIKMTAAMELGQKQFTEADQSLLKNLNAQMASSRYFGRNEVDPGEEFDYTAGEVGAPAIIPKYPTLALESEIHYNIYFDIENMYDVSASNMGLLLFDSKDENGTVETAKSNVSGAVLSWSNKLYMVHTDGIPAKEMGDTIYFKIYAKLNDGTYIYSDCYSYSVVQYVNEILANPSSTAEVKSLCVSLLNYGAAAQTYFGYKTDSLMNAGLTAEQQSYVSSYSDSIISSVAVDSSKVGSFTKTGSGFNAFSPAVSFEGAFSINYYIKPTNTIDTNLVLYYWTEDVYNSVDELTAENASGSVRMIKTGGYNEDGIYTYTCSYTDIAAKEINQAVYIAAEYTSGGTRYCTGVVGYSIGAYCKNLIEDTQSTQATIDLAKATALYGHYAEEYFA